MEGEINIPPWLKSELLQDSGALGGLKLVEESIDHEVAHQEDALARPAFAGEMDQPFRIRNKQELREHIGNDAVDLLRHTPVAAAQPCFHVSDGKIQLGGRQGAGHGRGYITDHDDATRLLMLREPG